MDKTYEEHYHQNEETHWWFKSRRKIIYQLIKNMKFKKDANILEIGCSGGCLMQLLKNKGFVNVHGIDISENAIKACKQKGILDVTTMDAAKTSFKDNSYDLLIASDILEHIEDDQQALIEWNRILKPKGILIVFVPAFNFLWTEHDVINMHYRRYSKTLLSKSLRASHFCIEKISFWNLLLFFPTYLLQLAEKFFAKKNPKLKNQLLFNINPLFNITLLVLLNTENFFLKFLNFPFGVSVFSVAKKV